MPPHRSWWSQISGPQLTIVTSIVMALLTYSALDFKVNAYFPEKFVNIGKRQDAIETLVRDNQTKREHGMELLNHRIDALTDKQEQTLRMLVQIERKNR